MPDQRHHRGPHPEDEALFAPEWHAALRAAVGDLSWLLSRDYASNGATRLVGDRYNLTARQRTAVQRCACSDEALARRRGRQVAAEALRGGVLLIDGYNVLTTVEVALSGGFVLVGRDGCWRDLASMHGTWRKVEETRPAIALVGRATRELGVERLAWYLDAPVSNSGRLKATIGDVSRVEGVPWTVDLVTNPDTVLSAADEMIATADSVVLDRCRRWFALANHIVRTYVPRARMVDLS